MLDTEGASLMSNAHQVKLSGKRTLLPLLSGKSGMPDTEGASAF